MSDFLVNFSLPSNLKKYQIIGYVEQGSYGYVYRAINKKTDEVAVVKIGGLRDAENNLQSLKSEIRTLLRMDHENIVRLVDCWESSENANESNVDQQAVLVLEDCMCDLGKVLRLCGQFSAEEVKTMATQMFRGLGYLERCQLAHCDVKPENILLSSSGYLKLCDFGLAKPFGVYKNNPGSTLAYSAPEVLLQTKKIGYEVDSWSAGCVFAQLYKMSRLFTCLHNDKTKQLVAIYRLCGSFTDGAFQELLPFLPRKYQKQPIKYQPCRLKSRITAFVQDSLAQDLLCQLLAMDPTQRLSSQQALESEFFQVAPLDTTDLKSFARKVETLLIEANV